MPEVSDSAMDLASMSAATLNYQRLHPAPMQFSRIGNTTQWFRPKEKPWVGKRYFYRVFTQGASGTRRAKFSTAAQGEFPIGQDLGYTELTVVQDDVKFFQATKSWNEIEDMLTGNKRYAVAKLTIKLNTEVEEDFAHQLNAAVNQGGNAMMAKVHTAYDLDGTSWNQSASAVLAAFIRIKDGSISQFMVGDILDIYDSDGSTQNCRVKVQDIIYGPNGPPVSGAPVADIGPGFLCRMVDADYALTTDVDWDGDSDADWGTSAYPESGDYIARSGEFTTTASSYANIHGFRDWFDTTVDVYRDNSGSTIDREAAGNHWMNPMQFDAGTSGSPADFDMELHFGAVEDYLPNRVKTGRRARGNAESEQVMMGTLTAIASVSIINDAVREANQSRQFTLTAAKTMNAATKRELFGEVGFDGIVYHSASMGTIALQADPMAEPETITILDPNSWFFITFGGTKANVNWVKFDSSGSVWHRKPGESNARPTFYLEGAAWTACALQCDQVAVNTRIRYVKSSRM